MAGAKLETRVSASRFMSGTPAYVVTLSAPPWISVPRDSEENLQGHLTGSGRISALEDFMNFPLPYVLARSAIVDNKPVSRPRA